MKEGAGKRWEDVGAPMSLHEAGLLAHALIAYEVGIFMRHTDGAGSLYWTSRYRDVFNSTLFDLRR